MKTADRCYQQEICFYDLSYLFLEVFYSILLINAVFRHSGPENTAEGLRLWVLKSESWLKEAEKLPL